MSAQTQLFTAIDSGASFSDCRKYRYALWRIWDKSKPLVMFIGLNPSTANETKSDPTITRVVQFAKNWGYGGVYMMNLFGLVSPYPEDLKNVKDAIGENTPWLEHVSKKCSQVIFAWGNFKEAEERSRAVKKMFPDAMALQINKNGSPKHPLYCKGDLTPIPYNLT